MSAEPKQARSATTALIYLTIGALMDVWTVIYYVHLWRDGGTGTQYLWCHGFLFSGLVLICIGLAVGRIGRNARQAEAGHPPDNTAPPQAAAQTAMVPVNGVLQPVAMMQQVPTAPVAAMPPSRQTTRA